MKALHMQRSIRIIRKCSQICLGFSIVLFLFFLFNSSYTEGPHISTDELQKITDFETMKLQAMMLSHGGKSRSIFAYLFCVAAELFFLLTIACTLICLIQLRHIEKSSDNSKSDGHASV